MHAAEAFETGGFDISAVSLAGSIIGTGTARTASAGADA
jgi:hypothetical protein